MIVQTTNKSLPQLKVIRNLELDKDQNPCYSFKLIGLGVFENTKELDLGSFGQEELLTGLDSLLQEIPTKKKTPIHQEIEM
jgi:hypothetical protein